MGELRRQFSSTLARAGGAHSYYHPLTRRLVARELQAVFVDGGQTIEAPTISASLPHVNGKKRGVSRGASGRQIALERDL